MIDGLPQDNSNSGSSKLAKLADENCQCKVLLTRRSWDSHRDELPIPNTEVFRLRPLNRAQQGWFLDRWFGPSGAPGQRQMIEEMIAHQTGGDFCNPLHLTLACAAAGQGRYLPSDLSRSGLYKHIVLGLISGDWGSYRKNQHETGIEFARLQQIAWHLFQSKPGEVSFTAQEWLIAFAQQHEDLNKISPLLNAWCSNGLLVGGKGQDSAGVSEAWKFTHPSFFEYLVAQHLTDPAHKATWCQEVVKVLKRDPGKVLGVMEFLGGLLKENQLLKLAGRVILAVPKKWHSWAGVLQSLLAGQRAAEGESPVLDVLRKAVAVKDAPASLHLHPQALLSYCYDFLSHPEAILARCHESLPPSENQECKDFATRLLNRAERQHRFWCHRRCPVFPVAGRGNCRAAPLHFAPVRQLAWVEPHLFSLGQDGTVAWWNRARGVIDYLPRTNSPISVFDVLPDGRLLLGSKDGEILLCSPMLSWQLQLLYRAWSPVTALLVCRNQQVPTAAIVGHDNGLLVRLNRLDHPDPKQLGQHRGPIRHLLELTEGWVASGGDDGVVRRWCLKDGAKQLLEPRERFGPIRGLTWCPNKKLIVSAHSTGVVACWPNSEGTVRVLLECAWPVSALAITSAGTALVGDKGGHVYLLDGGAFHLDPPHHSAVAGIVVKDNQGYSVDEAGNLLSHTIGHPDASATDQVGPKRLCWLDRDHLAFGGSSGQIEIKMPLPASEIPDRQRNEVADDLDRAIVGVVPTRPDGLDFIAAARDGTFTYGRSPVSRRRYKEPISCLVLAGEQVVAGTDTGKIILFDAQRDSGREIHAIRGKVTTLAWWQSRGRVVYGDTTGRVRFLSLSAGKDSTAGWPVPRPVSLGAAVKCIGTLGEFGIVVGCADGTLARLLPDKDEFERIDNLPGLARNFCLQAWEDGQAVVSQANGSIALAGKDLCFTPIPVPDQLEKTPILALDRWVLPSDQFPQAANRRNVIISGHRDGSIRFWQLDNEPRILSTKPHRGPITHLATSRSMVAASATDGVVSLWRGKSPKHLTKYIVDDSVTALAWLHDEQLAVGLGGGEVIVLTVRLPPEDGAGQR